MGGIPPFFVGGGRIKTASQMVSSTAIGAVLQIRWPLEPPVVASKLSGHANLSVVDGAIHAAQAIADGQSQSIIVRGESGPNAVERQYTLMGAVPLSVLTITPPAPAYTIATASGATIFSIAGVPSGVTPTISPNDGRVVIAGDQTNGWRAVRGLTATSVGSTTYAVSAPGAVSASAPVTVSEAPVAGNKLFASRGNHINALTFALAGVTGYTMRTTHSLVGSWSELEGGIANWLTSNGSTSGDTNGVNPFTVVEARAIYNGVNVQLTKNGATQWTILPTDDTVWHDTITPSQFGAETFADGTSIVYLVNITVPSAGGALPRPNKYNGVNAGGIGGWVYDPAVTTPNISVTADAPTFSGTAPTTTAFGPFVWLRGTPVNPDQDAYALFVDSFTDGNATGPALAVADLDLPYFNFAVVAAKTTMAINSPRVQALYDHVSYAHIWGGTNDVPTASATSILSNIATRIGHMVSHGVKGFIVGELLNRTGSTNNWVDAAEQTPDTGFGAGGHQFQFNDLLPTLSVEGASIVIAKYHNPLSDADNNTLWRTDGSPRSYNYDSKHPSNKAYPVISQIFAAAHGQLQTVRPVNTTAPQITGSPSLGYTASISAGTWTGFPNSFSYQKRRNGISVGAPIITSASSITDEYVAGDVSGSPVSWVVTASNGAGNASAASNAVIVTAGYSFVNSEAAAYVARFPSDPNDQYKQVIDTLIGTLKSSGYWELADMVHIAKGQPSEGAALLNLKDDSHNLTKHGEISWSALSGFTGDGVTGYLETGFIPSTSGGVMARDSAHLMAAVGGDIDQGAAVIGSVENLSTGPRIIMIPRNSNRLQFTINSSAGVQTSQVITTSDNRRFFTSRTGASSAIARVDKTTLSPTSNASTGIAAQNITYLRNGTAFSTRDLYDVGVGAQINATIANQVVDAFAAFYAGTPYGRG